MDNFQLVVEVRFVCPAFFHLFPFGLCSLPCASSLMGYNAADPELAFAL